MSIELTAISRLEQEASKFQTTCCTADVSKLGCPFSSKQSRQLVEEVQLEQMGEHDSEEPSEEHSLAMSSTQERRGIRSSHDEGISAAAV